MIKNYTRHTHKNEKRNLQKTIFYKLMKEYEMWLEIVVEKTIIFQGH